MILDKAEIKIYNRSDPVVTLCRASAPIRAGRVVSVSSSGQIAQCEGLTTPLALGVVGVAVANAEPGEICPFAPTGLVADVVSGGPIPAGAPVHPGEGGRVLALTGAPGTGAEWLLSRATLGVALTAAEGPGQMIKVVLGR